MDKFSLGQSFCILCFPRVGMTYHRQSFLWRGFCLFSPFSSLMNQWVFRSLSQIDLQHEMCLIVFRQFRNHQQERLSFLLLHISASQKMVFLSFSFCRTISLSVRPLQVNFTLKYRFQMILIVLVRSVFTVFRSIECSLSKLSHNAFFYEITSSKTRSSVLSQLWSKKLHNNIKNNWKTKNAVFVAMATK